VRKVFTLIPSLILLSLSSPGYAAEIDEEEYVLEFELDAIVVEENFNRQVDDVELELHSGFVNVIERQEFKSTVQTAADVVRKEAGLQIRQSGGIGSFSMASLRGSSTEQVVIYLDGMPLNSAGSAGFDLGSIELADIESIEVFRGSTPMHLAQASIGGAINIKRLRNTNTPRHNLTLSTGSFSTKKVALYTDNRIGKLDYTLSLTHSESKNDYTFWNNKGTLLDSRDDENNRRNNSQFDQQNILLKLDYALPNSSKLQFSHQYQAKQQHLPSWNNMADINTHLNKIQHHAQIAWSRSNVGKFNVDLMTKLDIRNNREKYDDREGIFGLNAEYIRYQSNSESLSQLIELPLSQHLFLANLNIQHEKSKPTDLKTGQDKPTSQRLAYTLALQDNWQVNDKLSLVPGIRTYAIRDDINANTTGILSTQYTQVINHRYIAPQIGAKYWLSDSLIIKSNAGRYFREPKFYELFGNQGFFLSNPELKAESGFNTDLGISWTPRTMPELIQQTRIEFVLFQSDIDNIIVRNFYAGYTKTMNIEKAVTQGAEIQLQLSTHNALELHAGATFLDARNMSPSDLPLYKKKLPGRFAEKYNLRISKNWAHLNIYADWLLEKGGFHDSTNNFSASKNIVDAGISYTYKNFSLHWDINNLTNNRYEDFYRYPMPERSSFISFKLKS